MNFDKKKGVNLAKLLWLVLFLPVSAAAAQVATPTFSPGAGTYSAPQAVSMSCATPGATIRLTFNGSEPTANSEAFTSISVSGNMTVKAKAFFKGMTDSATATAIYNMVVATPTFSVGTGTYHTPQAVSLSSVTPGATIRLTFNGSEPTANSEAFTSMSVSGNMTVKAKAFFKGMTDSATATATYSMVVATPTFRDLPTSPATVSISCDTPGATIRYTLDGSEPTAYSMLYVAGHPVSGPTKGKLTIKAKAFLRGMTDSAVAIGSLGQTPSP